MEELLDERLTPESFAALAEEDPLYQETPNAKQADYIRRLVRGEMCIRDRGSAEQQQPQQHVPGPGPGHGPDHGAPLVVVLPVPLPPGGVLSLIHI